MQETWDSGSICRSGRPLGVRHGNPLQYSCPENPMTEEPGRLQPIEFQRVEHNWIDLACMHTHLDVSHVKPEGSNTCKCVMWSLRGDGVSRHQSFLPCSKFHCRYLLSVSGQLVTLPAACVSVNLVTSITVSATLSGSDTWREWPQGPHSGSCWLVSFLIVLVFHESLFCYWAAFTVCPPYHSFS